MPSRATFCGVLVGSLFLPLFGLSQARADSMRCGLKLVSNGDSLYDVESRCGPPDDKQHRTEVRTERRWQSAPCGANNKSDCGTMHERSSEVVIDEWLYDFGPQSFMERLYFENGRLVRVVTGARGSKRAKPKSP